MRGTKRKASFAFQHERPSKITKKKSSTTVSKTLSTITKQPSVFKPPLKMPKFSSLRVSKRTASSAPLTNVGESTTPPSLRRASTLTLDDESGKDSAKSPLTKRKSSASKPISFSKKSSSFVEEGALVTKLSGLRSGSIVGETSLAASTSITKSPSVSKSLSRKSSSVKSTESSKVPSLPSGLTKFALPKSNSKSGSLRFSKSTLVSDVDETEMSSALDDLKTLLSKEGSMKRSLSRSASLRSRSSIKITTESKRGKDWDTSTAGPSSDGLMEVAISFDTTGSMYSCLEEVKAKIQDLVQRLQTDIPGIRVAVIAHGDYCDEANYVIKWIDFGATLPEICDFVKNVGRTGGGDGPECYELVLQRSREVLSWTDGSKRILVMISDNIPHEPGYMYGGKTYFINWRDECAALKEMGVKIYGVQAGFAASSIYHPATKFNDEMARITGGKRLSLKNFSCIFDVLMMICYREGNPEMLAVYEQEIIDRGERMSEDITQLKRTFDMAPGIPPLPVTSPFFGATPPRVPFTSPLFGAPLARAPFTSAPFGAMLARAPFISPPFGAPIPSVPCTPTRFGTVNPTLPITSMRFGSVTAPKRFTSPVFGAPTTHLPFAPTLFGTGVIKGKSSLKRTTKMLKPTAGKVGKMTAPKMLTVKKREKVPDSCVNKDALKNFTWSKWVCSVEPKMPTSKKKFEFLKLRTNHGYGPKSIFDGNMKAPALYEVAVKMPSSQKKYVVYFRMSKTGFKSRGHWSTNLFSQRDIRGEINNVLDQGCSVYVRRGVPTASTTDEIKSQFQAAAISFRDNYDYAWVKYKWRPSRDSGGNIKLKHRSLDFFRKGTKFTLSDNSI